MRDYLKNYIATTWKEYYNPAVYMDAGLENPFDIREETFQSEAARSHRREISTGCIRFLMQTGILAEQPQL